MTGVFFQYSKCSKWINVSFFYFWFCFIYLLLEINFNTISVWIYLQQQCFFLMIQLKHFFSSIWALQASYRRAAELNWNGNRNGMIAKLTPKLNQYHIQQGCINPNWDTILIKMHCASTDIVCYLKVFVTMLCRTQAWWRAACLNVQKQCWVSQRHMIHNTEQEWWR